MVVHRAIEGGCRGPSPQGRGGLAGANGVLLQEIADRPGTAVGTDLGANYMGPRGTADLGIGVSAVTLQRYGSAIAIYLPP